MTMTMLDINTTFCGALERLARAEVSESVWTAAVEWYMFQQKNKHYHNMAHALNVVRAINFIDDNPSASLLLAGLWHDAVYVPTAGSNANELCSAAALFSAFQDSVSKSRTAGETVDLARQLISNTHVGIHLYSSQEEGDLAVLLDADLSSLAATNDVFEENQASIIKENYGNPNDQEARKKSALFLKQFLTNREFIYHTAKARELWESSARVNIQQYVDLYS